MKRRRSILDIAKRIIRSPLCRPLLERYIVSKVRKINHHANPDVAILVTDQERFWPGDLERLSQRAQLFSLPSELRGLLHALYFTTKEMHGLRQNVVTDEFEEKERQFTKFFRNIIESVAVKIKFDCILTCNYLYVQNRLIAKACAQSAIPFIDLNRESKQDKHLNAIFHQKYIDQGCDMSFNGNALCVYNDNMKSLLLQLKAAPAEKIHTVGALRTDLLIERARRVHSLPLPQQVTLFSFRHMPIGSNEWEYLGGGFSLDRSKGLIRLFDDVHAAMAELASNNPEVSFVIKAKFRGNGVWTGQIAQAIERAGYEISALKNLRIVAQEIDAIDLIFDSSVVIGLNSMTLVQARLANRVVIQPYYHEIADLYRDSLQYRDIQSEFVVPRSHQELIDQVQDCIDSPGERPCTSRPFEQYIGFTDGRNLDRFMDVVLKEVAKSKTRHCANSGGRGRRSDQCRTPASDLAIGQQPSKDRHLEVPR